MRLPPVLPSAPIGEAGDAASNPGQGDGDGFRHLMAELDAPARIAGTAEPLPAPPAASLRGWGGLPDAPPAADANGDALAAAPFANRDLMAADAGEDRRSRTAARPDGREAGEPGGGAEDRAPVAAPPSVAAEPPAPLDTPRLLRVVPAKERTAPASPEPRGIAEAATTATAPAGARPAARSFAPVAFRPNTASRPEPQSRGTEPLPQEASPGGLPAGTWALLMKATPAADGRDGDVGTTGARTVTPSADPGEAMADAAAEPRMTVSVLHRETHFAPVRSFTQAGPEGWADRPAPASAGPDMQASPADDLPAAGTAPEIAPEIAPAPAFGPALSGTTSLAVPQGPAPLATRVGAVVAGEAARLAPAVAPEGGATPGGPVRVLELALSPETLGRVVVRLRLTPDGLSVRLRADNPETARLLEEDRPRLMQALAAAGTGPVDMEFADRLFASPPAAAPDARVRENAGEDATGDERRRSSRQEQQDETPSQARRGRGDAAAG